MAAVVGKGWAKDESAIRVRGPSVAVFGAGEGKTELARRVERVGGEVIRKTVEARPSREGGVRAPRAHNIEGDFGKGEEPVPKVVGKVRVVEERMDIRWFLPVLIALSAGLLL